MSEHGMTFDDADNLISCPKCGFTNNESWDPFDVRYEAVRETDGTCHNERLRWTCRECGYWFLSLTRDAGEGGET